MIMPFATQFYLKGSGVDQHTPQAAIPGQQVYCSIRSHRCCKHGELPATSHASGQTMCMCQMNQSIQTYVQRAPILPEACFDATTSYINATASFFGEKSSALCPSITNLPKDSLNMASASASFYYDNLLVSHPYGPFYPGVDLSNAARRKNATRGTTSALKAWLYEHRKNPYPAKGEKIMLAFVTRMTLTQVSTWFANARRRLKKDKRMDWSLNDHEEESEYNLTTEKGNNEDDNHVDKDAEENLSYQCSTSDDNDKLNISNISDPEDQSYLKNKPTIKEHFLGLPLYASGHEKNNVKQNDCKNVSGQTVRRGDSTAFNSTSNSERITFYTSNEAETVNPTRHPSENGNFKTKIWSIIDIIGSSDNLNSASKSTGTCSSSHKIRTSSDSHLTLVSVDPSSYSTASTNQHTHDNF